MEYLSRCLGELQLNPNFHFHPKCEKIKLTHLMFIDYPLLFSRADHISVTKLMTSLSRFSHASGLEANVDKSAIYLSGVIDEVKNQLADNINMLVGDLPLKYLRVPFSAKTLSPDGITIGIEIDSDSTSDRGLTVVRDIKENDAP